MSYTKYLTIIEEAATQYANDRVNNPDQNPEAVSEVDSNFFAGAQFLARIIMCDYELDGKIDTLKLLVLTEAEEEEEN